MLDWPSRMNTCTGLVMSAYFAPGGSAAETEADGSNASARRARGRCG
ncbi:MAG: hypothetical protein U1F77_04350 [Kiritimatiellia bacterium]